jgi:CheY-like chemotaxis protein
MAIRAIFSYPPESQSEFLKRIKRRHSLSEGMIIKGPFFPSGRGDALRPFLPQGFLIKSGFKIRPGSTSIAPHVIPMDMEEKMRSNCSILIVDDEFAVRESLRILLKPYYDIYTAADGEEALKIIKKRKIHLITLDLHMPKLSGIDTLREIRKIKSEVHIVMITGYATNEDKEQALLYGAKAFISKPFNTKELISVIDGIVESPIECEPPSYWAHGYRLSMKTRCSLGSFKPERRPSIADSRLPRGPASEISGANPNLSHRAT